MVDLHFSFINVGQLRRTHMLVVTSYLDIKYVSIPPSSYTTSVCDHGQMDISTEQGLCK